MVVQYFYDFPTESLFLIKYDTEAQDKSSYLLSRVYKPMPREKVNTTELEQLVNEILWKKMGFRGWWRGDYSLFVSDGQREEDMPIMWRREDDCEVSNSGDYTGYAYRLARKANDNAFLLKFNSLIEYLKAVALEIVVLNDYQFEVMTTEGKNTIYSVYLIKPRKSDKRSVEFFADFKYPANKVKGVRKHNNTKMVYICREE